MRGPPITIKCECGEKRSLGYGERWECERCGRSWNTAQIPAHEYESLVRDLRRYRLELVVAAVVISAVLIPLAFVVNQALMFSIPVLLGVFAIAYGPFWKRKVRRRIHDAPRWNLQPE